MIDRLLSLVVALSLAVLVWLYARSRDQETLDSVPVPVEVALAPALAEHYHLEVGGPNTIPVNFTGQPARLRDLHAMLQRQELRVLLTITVPDERLREARFSDVARVESGAVKAPAGITAQVVEGRNRIAYTLHRLVARRLPVRFEPLGDGPPVPVIVEPATVLVHGPQEVLDRVRFLPTEPSEPPSRPMSGSTYAALSRVPLVRELEGRPVRVVPNSVRARVPPQTRRVYDLADVPVQFLCPPGFRYRARFHDERNGKVSLKVAGPIQDEPPKVHAFIDVTRSGFLSGLHHEPLQIQLPKEFQLVEDRPRVIAFVLDLGDFNPGGLGRDGPGLPTP